MGDVNEYRQIVEKVITDIGAILTSTPELARNVILDRSSDNYLILTQGWENRRRINQPVFTFKSSTAKSGFRRTTPT
jgi:hypothetical protein